MSELSLEHYSSEGSSDLITSALRQFLTNFQAELNQKVETPSDWIERYFYVPDPRDPITGEMYSPGPIRLSDHQRRIINEALSRDEKGNLKYSTIIYSAPKKSGKSALTSAVILYMAYHNPNSFLACMANDGTQANDRLYGPIETNFRIHRQINGPLKDEQPHQGEVLLSNFSKIRAVPVDAAGEAGSQPLVSAFSELWGYTTDRKRRLWTEFTVPPTLYGKATRIVETYAGYTGESDLLEELYDLAFKQGTPHPDFLDLQGTDGPVVRVNNAAGTFCYWDTEPRMLWQTPEYYFQQAATMPPSEFQRMHRNQWVTPVGAFIQEAWWDACLDPTLPFLKDGDRTPVIVGIDAAVTRDCAALVAVTRDPTDPITGVAVRGVKVFSPKELGGTIIQEDTIGATIREWKARWNVICWAYDPREMAKLAQDYMRANFGWFMPFSQQQLRAVADKELHDMVVHNQIKWNPVTTEGDVGSKGTMQETLYRHITQAGAEISGNSYRLEKLSVKAHIDAAVALSMATYQCMKLSVGNVEHGIDSLVQRLARGDLTVEEFSRLVRVRHPELEKLLHGNR